jgi:hypothetical protein
VDEAARLCGRKNHQNHRDIDVAVFRACRAAPEASVAYYAAQSLGGFFLEEIPRGDWRRNVQSGARPGRESIRVDE